MQVVYYVEEGMEWREFPLSCIHIRKLHGQLIVLVKQNKPCITGPTLSLVIIGNTFHLNRSGYKFYWFCVAAACLLKRLVCTLGRRLSAF